MLVRVGDFGVEQGGLFPSTTTGGQMFAAVAATVAELSQHATNQVKGGGTAREGVTAKAGARQALRSQLEKIARTARALAVDTPELHDTFWLPGTQTDQGLLSTARAFAAAATPLATAFVTHEMPATFLADLTTAIGQFEAAIHDRDAGKATHAAAQAGITAAIRSGMTAVRKLDAIVPNKLDHDPVALAAWEKTRHVETASRSRHGATTAATATPGSAPGTPAAANGSTEHS
jgi:hypothetical protein